LYGEVPWNEQTLGHLTGNELGALAHIMVTPKSGTKARQRKRLINVRQVRETLGGFASGDSAQDARDLEAAMNARDLKGLAKVAGSRASGRKSSIAAGLIQWRDDSRRKGKARLAELRRVRAGGEPEPAPALGPSPHDPYDPFGHRAAAAAGADPAVDPDTGLRYTHDPATGEPLGLPAPPEPPPPDESRYGDYWPGQGEWVTGQIPFDRSRPWEESLHIQMDPADGSEQGDPTAEMQQLDAEEWKGPILEGLLHLDYPSFSDLAFAVAGVTAGTAAMTEFDHALWQLISDGLVAHTREVPVFFGLTDEGAVVAQAQGAPPPEPPPLHDPAPAPPAPAAPPPAPVVGGDPQPGEKWLAMSAGVESLVMVLPPEGRGHEGYLLVWYIGPDLTPDELADGPTGTFDVEHLPRASFIRRVADNPWGYRRNPPMIALVGNPPPRAGGTGDEYLRRLEREALIDPEAEEAYRRELERRGLAPGRVTFTKHTSPILQGYKRSSGRRLTPRKRSRKRGAKYGRNPGLG
jgi:hypothetical protein